MSNWQSNPVSTHSNNKIINKTYDIVTINARIHIYTEFICCGNFVVLQFVYPDFAQLVSNTISMKYTGTYNHWGLFDSHVLIG